MGLQAAGAGEPVVDEEGLIEVPYPKLGPAGRSKTRTAPLFSGSVEGGFR